MSVLVTVANTVQEVQFSSSDSFPLTAGTASLPDLILRDPVEYLRPPWKKDQEGELVSSPLVFNIPTDIQFGIVQVRLDVHASYTYQVKF